MELASRLRPPAARKPDPGVECNFFSLAGGGWRAAGGSM